MITTDIKSEVIVKQGFTNSKDEVIAVKELYEQIYQPDASIVVLFASSKFNLESLGAEINNKFTVPVIGCTTSGEISPDGYQEGSLTGFSLASEQLEISQFAINQVTEFDLEDISEIGKQVKAKLSNARKKDPNVKTFGLFLIDGLSVMEEQVIAHLYHILDGIPLIGGSAGDDLKFKKTFVYSNGKFVSNIATITFFTTSLPFETFKTQHFVPTEKKLVITKADPKNRVVYEIDGKPAAWEYANLLGLEIDELEPMVFSKYPVMLRIGGEYYVRSIQKVNNDGSLQFFCAIDEGLVLTISEGIDLISNTESALKKTFQKVSNPAVVISCECILRRLEVIEKNLVNEVNDLYKKYKVIGFHTYGEQFNSIHVNQTFTGVVIGS